jgi:circadian clock protein KaiC
MPDQKTRDPSALVKTGIPGLDDILGGGLPPSRMYLIEGDPGAGKTTLALRFLLEGVKLGEKGLYITLSETREEILDVATSHGWSLSEIDILEMDSEAHGLAEDAQNTMFYPAEVELSELMKSLLAEIERVRPTRLVFDSLSELRLLARDPLRYRRQILALKQFFAGQKFTVLLLDDRSSPSTDLQLQSLAHGVVSLERRSPEYGVMQRRMQIVKLRGQAFRAGYHDFILRRGGLDVFPRLVAAEHHVEFPDGTLLSGVPALDQLLGGGLDRGTSTLVVGPPGAGKSALSTQFAVTAARRGEKSVIFTFEESLRTMTARSTGLGQDLKVQVDAGVVRIQRIDPAELSPGQFSTLLRDLVEGEGIRVIVLDSLNGYLNAMPDVRYLMLHLHELLTYLGQQGVNTFLIMSQHGLLGPAMVSPFDASYVADSVILLRFFEARGEMRQAVSVMKKRGGTHERTIREIRLLSGGIAVGEPLRDFHGVLTGVPTIERAPDASGGQTYE